LEYHSVSRDGIVIHRKSDTGRTGIRSFTHPTPLPSRKSRRTGEDEHSDLDGRNMEYNEKLEYQPLHINYTSCLITDRPSLHNKTARIGRRRSPRPVSKKYAAKTVEIEYDYETGVNDENDVVSEEYDVFEELSHSRLLAADLSSFIVKKGRRMRKRREKTKVEKKSRMKR
ncbi:hypothetical protein PMAYCL1PPCAC_01063, partial [Pristionchus mayeri]